LSSSGVLEEVLTQVKDAAAQQGFKPRITGWGEARALMTFLPAAAWRDLALPYHCLNVPQ
jgi:hypothetical protein